MMAALVKDSRARGAWAIPDASDWTGVERLRGGWSPLCSATTGISELHACPSGADGLDHAVHTWRWLAANRCARALAKGGARWRDAAA